jgi:hypothetical protein
VVDSAEPTRRWALHVNSRLICEVCPNHQVSTEDPQVAAERGEYPSAARNVRTSLVRPLKDGLSEDHGPQADGEFGTGAQIGQARRA